ncbi:MAG TPA: hypothetical protein PKA59_12005 [Chakrabartia sp.]|jgi:hypothetical protein|nr:hypothetical protein [Chakrabartia sp.]
MAEKFEKHKQPWTAAELERMRTLARKGETARGIAKAIKRSEDSVKERARAEGLTLGSPR